MRTFQTLVSQTEVDPSVFNRIMSNGEVATRDYVILFGGRTGSSWLTYLLLNLLGQPKEHINPEFIAGHAVRVGTKDPSEFLRAIRQLTQRNGVFGIEATCEHIEIFGEDCFFRTILQPVIFHLWRENIVAQAISIYRAVKTGRFHSIQGESAPDPEYIPEEMIRWLQYMARVENANLRLIDRRSLNPINLTYETITKNPESTLQLFHESLDIPLPSQLKLNNPIEKLANHWNVITEQRFRSDCNEVIAEIESNRLVKKHRLISVL